MRDGHMTVNSVDLKHSHVLKKLFKNMLRCEMCMGNEMDLDHFLDKIVNFLIF